MASGHGQGGMTLSMKLVRLLIILLNLAIFIIGAVLVASGCYVMKDPKLQQLRFLLNPNLTSAYSQSLSYIELFAIAIIMIGGVLLAIGFLGCCGAIKGFRFLHVLYAFIIGVIIIAEIAMIVVFFAYQHQVKNELVIKLRQSISAYYVGTPVNNSTNTNPVSLSWDFAQFNLLCCGAISKNDFVSAKKWDRINPYQADVKLVVPFTCCPLGAVKSWTELPSDLSVANTCATTGLNSYSQGCYDRLLDVISAYKKNFILILVVVGVVEILAFICSLCLYCRKDKYTTL